MRALAVGLVVVLGGCSVEPPVDLDVGAAQSADGVVITLRSPDEVSDCKVVLNERYSWFRRREFYKGAVTLPWSAFVTEDGTRFDYPRQMPLSLYVRCTRPVTASEAFSF